MISNLKRGEQKNDKFINKGFIHLRSVRTLSNIISVEIFGQLEYDDFIKLKKRQLAGVGLRILSLQKPDLVAIHVGVGVMKEIEAYTVSSESNKDLFRSTNYLTTNFVLNNTVNLFATGYYQVNV